MITMRHFLLLCLLLCLTIPLHAQDNPTPYDIALQRIQEAAVGNTTYLDLSGLGLTEVPREVWQLRDLQWLDMSNNQLVDLPPEIGTLSNLFGLSVRSNQLTSLPREINRLINLQQLFLDNNQLRDLPIEVGELTNLTCADCYLLLDSNPLISPPPEVVEQGTAAVLAYLRNQAWYHVQRLIISVAAGVGLLAMLLLGVRYRQSQRKSKVKNDYR
jgi:internalin A